MTPLEIEFNFIVYGTWATSSNTSAVKHWDIDSDISEDHRKPVGFSIINVVKRSN